MSAETWLDFDALLAKPWVARFVSLVLSAGTGTVLALAAWLQPAVEGHGTHLQLGLGTCSFLLWTGQPCPMCGATTTFTLMAHLRFGEAVVNQPFAAFLFLLTVAIFAVATAEWIAPRGRWGKILRPLEVYEGWLAVAFLGFMAAGWLYKAVVMSGA